MSDEEQTLSGLLWGAASGYVTESLGISNTFNGSDSDADVDQSLFSDLTNWFFDNAVVDALKTVKDWVKGAISFLVEFVSGLKDKAPVIFGRGTFAEKLNDVGNVFEQAMAATGPDNNSPTIENE